MFVACAVQWGLGWQKRSWARDADGVNQSVRVVLATGVAP
jgi:hypothetical protein